MCSFYFCIWQFSIGHCFGFETLSATIDNGIPPLLSLLFPHSHKHRSTRPVDCLVKNIQVLFLDLLFQLLSEFLLLTFFNIIASFLLYYHLLIFFIVLFPLLFLSLLHFSSLRYGALFSYFLLGFHFLPNK